MDEADHLEILVRVTLNLAQQRHIYPQGLLKRLTEAQAAIVRELVCNHTPRAEWLADWGKKDDAIQAAAKDPAERIRIAKLAAEARWRGHKKKPSIRKRITDALKRKDPPFRIRRLPLATVKKYGLPTLAKDKSWAARFGYDCAQHILNGHGNPKQQAKQKQVAVKKSDFPHLIRMIAYPDSVVPAGKNKDGMPRYKITSTRKGILYTAIVELSYRSHGLLPVTLYKSK